MTLLIHITNDTEKIPTSFFRIDLFLFIKTLIIILTNHQFLDHIPTQSIKKKYCITILLILYLLNK